MIYLTLLLPILYLAISVVGLIGAKKNDGWRRWLLAIGGVFFASLGIVALGLALFNLHMSNR